MAASLSSRGKLLGEFTLIVVGVLFALMVDAWIEQRSERSLRNEYLERLAGDIEADRKILNERIRFFGAVRDYGKMTLDWIESDDEPSLRIATAAFFAAEVWPFVPIEVTYRDLQSTGNIRLLDDLELRTRLAEYYAGAAQRATAWDLPEDYRAIARGYVSLELQQRLRLACPSSDLDRDQSSIIGESECSLPNVPYADYAPALNALRAHTDVARALRYRLSEIDISILLYQSQLALAEQTIAPIRERLNGD